MKLSKRVYKVNWVALVTALLLIDGSAAAQNPKPKVWGRPVDGLQMRIYQAEDGQSKVPKFRVELRNAGEKDLVLNLGIMNRNGSEQYPTAVSLFLEDAQRLSRRLELKRPLQASDAGKEALHVPLPVGATFSFLVDLDNYREATSKELDYKLKPGTYRLAAHLTGFRADSRRAFTVGAFTVASLGDRPGQPPPVFERTFDMVNPETTLGPPPISNTLQFEVPDR